MENITKLFTDVYKPRKGLIIYQSEERSEDIYVEAYDIGSSGRIVNAHPLSVEESELFGRCFTDAQRRSNCFSQSKGLLPNKVLYIPHADDGYILWHTPMQEVQLFFTESLGIESGKAYVPPLIWKGCKDALYIYTIKEKPCGKTLLYYAPFFNIHEDGLVCMGTVDADVSDVSCLEDFIEAWEGYFWNSYFSHLIGDRSPINGNIVQLWQQQIATRARFPMDVLLQNGKTIQDLLK